MLLENWPIKKRYISNFKNIQIRQCIIRLFSIKINNSPDGFVRTNLQSLQLPNTTILRKKSRAF